MTSVPIHEVGQLDHVPSPDSRSSAPGDGILGTSASRSESADEYWRSIAAPRLEYLENICSSLSHQDSRATIKTELDAIHRMVQSFGSHHNSIIPISSLPPDILARIFERLVPDYPPGIWGRTNLGWITVTHVCRRWRRVAMEEAKFWVKPAFTLGHKWVSEMIARAQGAPVEITFLDFGPKSETTESPYLQILRKHLPQTGTLKLVEYPRLSTTSSPDLFDSPAPLLESFAMGRQYDELKNREEPLKILPDSRLFAGEAPNLRSISLYHYRSPWASFPRSTSLSELRIMFPKKVPSSQERCLNDPDADLLTLLTHSPALEELVLHFCLPPSNHMKARPRTLQLPKLKKLDIAGESGRVVQLLDLLDLPTDVSLSFRCVSTQRSGSDSCRIFPVLVDHYNRTGAPVLRSLNILLREFYTDADGSMELVFSSRLPIAATSFSDDLEAYRSDSRLLELSCGFESATPGTDDGLLEVLRQACSSLPLTGIEFVEIVEGYESADMHLPHECPELFKQFEQLTTIRCNGPCIAPVLRAITPRPATPAPSASITRPIVPAVNNKKKKNKKAKAKAKGGPNPAQSASIDNTSPPIVPFRHLTTLAIEDADILPLPLRTNEAVQALLSNAVVLRIKCGLPIRKLEIEICNIEGVFAQMLGKLVPNFTWDGDEGALGDYDASEIYGYDDSD